ncbi:MULTISPECIES: phosphoribosylglycinamide formyltransferase [Frankia]|uniref:Phosphoribosylglycinamide formyltransferase n=2 Tax=Frankia casuarinae (strain DSM 45818 / CECT 9043 / HFP020203 / CcI3) TaxID=106370 RepID=Q2JE89_FRACC|nr:MULTISPECIES: phosphoribosylglycinamide formyltransferase [Frankia]ABD10403.1 formyltetrahydrofolate-dependent phosphoribosylglycinamide formyltransferase [Frankia casuarinae]ORT94127.1 phosphoribosylglycinamide formyltransferase [Frankia casuarinae]
MADFRVAVFASHTGTNLRALHQSSLRPAAAFRLALVLSNNGGSGALAYARAHAIPAAHMSGVTHPDPDQLDTAICTLLNERKISLIVTAGYMKNIGPCTLKSYAGKIINVHPSLLPRHGGKGMYGRAVHESVLASGDRITGPSVHIVTAEYDAGPVIAQHELPVQPDETVESLSERVLAAEHILLPTVVQDLAVHAI